MQVKNKSIFNVCHVNEFQLDFTRDLKKESAQNYCRYQNASTIISECLRKV